MQKFMVDGMPDRTTFLGLITPVLEHLWAGHANVRLFGEMVNLLWDHNLAATVRLEELWNEVLADQGVSLLCAYRIDPFDRHAHRGVLHKVSRCHSHVVPVDDDDRLEHAVERALGDTFGSDAKELGHLITSRHPAGTAMPLAEAVLFAVRNLSSRIGDELLDRARHYYRAS